jgi:hypothetical protein
MNMINALTSGAGKSRTLRKEEVSILIGKAWVKEDGRFSIVPLSEPVEGKKGQFQISGIYPFIVTDYCRISVGVNKKRDEAKNQNTHWVFLNVEKERLEDYAKLLGKIGQKFSAE